MGTRIFPDALFVQAPVEQFINESYSGYRNGFSPVVVGGQGVMRMLPPGRLLIMPAAVAHARPDGHVEDYPPAGPRWFARAQLELRPAGGRGAWDTMQRMEVSLLVAQHVWGDAAFLDFMGRGSEYLAHPQPQPLRQCPRPPARCVRIFCC